VTQNCRPSLLTILLWAISTLLILGALIGCIRPAPVDSNAGIPSTPAGLDGMEAKSPETQNQTDTGIATVASLTPASPLESGSEEFFILHPVVAGDTLGLVARQYETSAEELMILNQIEDINIIYEGQILRVPGPNFEKLLSPDFHIIPDSELVYGPSAKTFQISDYAESLQGYLINYEEEVEGYMLDGPQIVQLVADRHSVNPRLLLAVLEYQSGWLSQMNPEETQYPLGNLNEEVEGLYKQLSWAANLLNWGYYGRAEGGLTSIVVGGEIPIIFPDDLNHGTAGVHYFMAARDNINYEGWLHDVSAEGFFKTYQDLFGNPFQNEIDPLVPEDLAQPPLELPWTNSETWFFTGGPHGGWNTGSAWAALDFVPPNTQGGCSTSASWVTAMADGKVTRSSYGAVVTDLDGDDYAGTGWAITYMHLEDADRVPLGTEVKTGDPIGHPGCVGGFTNGTHVHVARTYNGRWISADGSLPFALGGWISEGSGSEYNGWLMREGAAKTADVLHSEGNAITAD
jgi:LasA protease